jgi:hypothetical protein
MDLKGKIRHDNVRRFNVGFEVLTAVVMELWLLRYNAEHTETLCVCLYVCSLACQMHVIEIFCFAERLKTRFGLHLNIECNRIY